MSEQAVVRDERTVSVENASYRLGYLVLSFGLLALVAYRGFFRQESNWDLLALVILGGAVTTAYQSGHKVLTRGWVRLALASFVIAAVVAIVIALLR